jgi:SAM-dependent methyltransferase
VRPARRPERSTVSAAQRPAVHVAAATLRATRERQHPRDHRRATLASISIVSNVFLRFALPVTLRPRNVSIRRTRHDTNMSDPLSGSAWSSESTVTGFATSPPNDTLLAFAAAERLRVPDGRAIDIGCGAGRNTIPLARQGWHVLGTDLSRPMLATAIARNAAEAPSAHAQFALAPMDTLPTRGRAFDLVVAHGIWNLARSAAEFRRAVDEAARVAAPGAALFVFTFSRHTLQPDVAPVPGEPFVFTQFSGQPQCFITHAQLLDELGRVGFAPDPRLPVTEHNLPAPGRTHAVRVPVIFEAAFRMTAARRDVSSMGEPVRQQSCAGDTA